MSSKTRSVFIGFLYYSDVYGGNSFPSVFECSAISVDSDLAAEDQDSVYH